MSRLRAVRPSPPREPDLSIDPALVSRILEAFIRTEVGRTGRSRVVLGLSGGLDSAVAAHLAARALGPGNVGAVVMPYRTSDPASLADAERVVGATGIVAEKVDISPIVDGFLAVSGEVGRLRLGNAAARARMIVLYDRSAADEALVLGTSNKTELLLGYSTLHGDMACAVNPLGDLYKTQVRELARWLRVPRTILDKAPSADLWPAQTDEDELGIRYETVDRLLALLVDARAGRATAIASGFAAAEVDRVQRMVVRSHFKRRQPLLAKVSTRSVGWDFRYPRDWKS